MPHLMRTSFRVHEYYIEYSYHLPIVLNSGLSGLLFAFIYARCRVLPVASSFKLEVHRYRITFTLKLRFRGGNQSCTGPLIAVMAHHVRVYTVQSWQSGWLLMSNCTLRTLYIVFWVQVIDVNANSTQRTT